MTDKGGGLYLQVTDALVHVRKPSGDCIGCVERALFEVLRQLVIEAERESWNDAMRKWVERE